MTDQGSKVKPGYVITARAMRDHHVVGFGSEGRYSKAEAWQDIIMECRYEPGKAMNRGRVMMLQRGEMIGAIAWLANRWNWTPKTVRGFLDQLERDGMIARFMVGPDGVRIPSKNGSQGGNHANIISICNYDTYQIAPDSKRQPKRQPEGNHGATRGQPEGNNLIKEINNNTPPLSPSPGESTKASRKSALPDAWSPNLDWVRERWNATDSQLAEQAERFRNYHSAKGSLMKNWDAAWRTWWLSGFHRIPKRAELNDRSVAAAKEAEMDAMFEKARRVLGL